MALRDIAVHLDESPRCRVRLDIALTLARLHFATVSAVFARYQPSDLAAAQQDFEQAIAAAGATGSWTRPACDEDDDALRHHVTTAASCADLMVMGQPDADQVGVPHDLVDHVLLHSGRPALVIPYAGTIESIGRRPLIAWNGGRESARALHDALPLMSHARQARLVMIENGRTSIEEGPILQHLSNHGIEGEVERLVAEDIGVMDLLLARLTDTGSDLLVMGAHGHLGLTGLHRGAGTRHILRHLTVPALMSH